MINQFQQNYLETKVEPRKVCFIARFIPEKCERIIDLGCGNGEYGRFLKQKTKVLVGIDNDALLAKAARAHGWYEEVLVQDAYPFAYQERCDAIWASEIIEHLSRLDIFDQLEAVATRVIVATMPNPAFPHYANDPSHILEYSVAKLKEHFAKNTGWEYTIYGSGFENVPFPRWLKTLNQKMLWRLPKLSPSLLVVGTCKKNLL